MHCNVAIAMAIAMKTALDLVTKPTPVFADVVGDMDGQNNQREHNGRRKECDV